MILFFALVTLSFHPLHISVTEIEYNEKHRALQIISRIFVDDLELSIQRELDLPNLDLVDTSDGLDKEKMIREYLISRVRVSVDSQPRDITFLGYERDEFVLKCYLEVKKVETFNRMRITNTIITETYDDQSNMVHVTYKGVVKSAMLRQSQPSGDFIF